MVLYLVLGCWGVGVEREGVKALQQGLSFLLKVLICAVIVIILLLLWGGFIGDTSAA